MQKNYKNKLQKGEKTKGEVAPFYFPKYNITVQATSLEEAQKIAEKEMGKNKNEEADDE